MTTITKLHRSRNNRMLAGVLGGVAEYYGWSPTTVRLVFVLVSIFSTLFPGVIIYIIFWILMPNADRYIPRSSVHSYGKSDSNERQVN